MILLQGTPGMYNTGFGMLLVPVSGLVYTYYEQHAAELEALGFVRVEGPAAPVAPDVTEEPQAEAPATEPEVPVVPETPVTTTRTLRGGKRK